MEVNSELADITNYILFKFYYFNELNTKKTQIYLKIKKIWIFEINKFLMF